jgi:hypothetical protein
MTKTMKLYTKKPTPDRRGLDPLPAGRGETWKKSGTAVVARVYLDHGIPAVEPRETGNGWAVDSARSLEISPDPRVESVR